MTSIHMDPFTTGNLSYQHDGPDHLGHRWRAGRCLECGTELRDVSVDRKCGDVHFAPRKTTWCPNCSRPIEPDGCPCRVINGIAP